MPYCMIESPLLPPYLRDLLRDLPLGELAFTPVPVRPRADGWTVERQQGFVQLLALIESVTAAARGVGMTKKSAYRLRARPGAESFAAAWDVAVSWGRSRVTALSLSRALAGEVRPYYYRGRKCGEHVRNTDSLLIAILNARDRESPATVPGGGVTPAAPASQPLKTKAFFR